MGIDDIKDRAEAFLQSLRMSLKIAQKSLILFLNIANSRYLKKTSSVRANGASVFLQAVVNQCNMVLRKHRAAQYVAG